MDNCNHKEKIFLISFSDDSIKLVHESCGGEVTTIEREIGVELVCFLHGYLFSLPHKVWKELKEVMEKKPEGGEGRIELSFTISGECVYTELAVIFRRRNL